jgi:hypothetical protein
MTKCDVTTYLFRSHNGNRHPVTKVKPEYQGLLPYLDTEDDMVSTGVSPAHTWLISQLLSRYSLHFRVVLGNLKTT